MSRRVVGELDLFDGEPPGYDRRQIIKNVVPWKEAMMRQVLKPGTVLLVAAFIVSGCSGGVSGPVVEGNSRSGGEDAQVFGEVIIEDDCIYLYQPETDTRYPVIWPHGTGWDADESEVVLPDGTSVGEGMEVHGGGGYHHLKGLSKDTTEEGIAVVSACVDNEFGEVAVFNSSGEIEVR